MCIFVILVTFFIINSISGFNYKDLDKHYRIYDFDTNGKVCSPSGVKEKLEITDKNRSAILITQAKLNERRKINLDCKFTVDATPFELFTKIKTLFTKEEENIGLFAVIQYMDLRFDPDREECIDYVQFRIKGKPYGSKLCGHENIGNILSNRESSDELSRLGFISETGAIETRIFIDKRPLNYHEHLELKIVYTAYRRCSLSSTDFCGTGSNGKCVPLEYFGDGLINCPYSSCSDEKNCEVVARNLEDLVSGTRPSDFDSDSSSTNTKVTIGAVTTLLVSFMMFIICVWCCKKWGKLCWAEDCVNPRSNEHRTTVRTQQPSRTIELENRSEPSVPTISPTAPPIDKDLPPSYDSLFPNRS